MKDTNILAIFANPRGSDPLRLGAEDRVIHECLNLSRYRNKFNLDVLHAATIDDVRRALLNKKYQILHFSGHGTNIGLAFEDPSGHVQLIPQDAIANLLSRYSPPIKCVIMNACYSDNQAQLISLGVPYTIGMDGPISDNAATEFSRGFYDAIGAGKNIEFAYKEGCDILRLKRFSYRFIPVLFKMTTDGTTVRTIIDNGNDGDRNEIIIAGRKKEIESFSNLLDNTQVKVDVIWFYGPSGIGKTELMVKLCQIAEKKGFEYKRDIIDIGEDISSVLSRIFSIGQIISPLSERENIKFRMLTEVINKLSASNTDTVIAIDTVKEFDDYEGLTEDIRHLTDRLKSLRRRTILLIASQNKPSSLPIGIFIRLNGLTAEEIKELIEIKGWDRKLVECANVLERWTGGHPWLLIEICRTVDAVDYLSKPQPQDVHKDVLERLWRGIPEEQKKTLFKVSKIMDGCSSSS